MKKPENTPIDTPTRPESMHEVERCPFMVDRVSVMLRL